MNVIQRRKLRQQQRMRALRQSGVPRHVQHPKPKRYRDLGLEAWPMCTVPGCGMEVDPRRFYGTNRVEGHRTCIEFHSEARAHFNVIEIPKSNPMVVRPGADIKGLASSHKGNRQAF